MRDQNDHEVVGQDRTMRNAAVHSTFLKPKTLWLTDKFIISVIGLVNLNFGFKMK